MLVTQQILVLALEEKEHRQLQLPVCREESNSWVLPGPQQLWELHGQGWNTAHHLPSASAASALSCLLSLTGSLPCRAAPAGVIGMAGAISLADLWPLPSGTNGQWVELSLYIDWISITFTGFLSFYLIMEKTDIYWTIASTLVSFHFPENITTTLLEITQDLIFTPLYNKLFVHSVNAPCNCLHTIAFTPTHLKGLYQFFKYSMCSLQSYSRLTKF